MSLDSVPCDDLREPFHSRGYCLNCNVLAQLHTEDGWRGYYSDRAASCDRVAVAARARADEMEWAARADRDLAERFQTRRPATRSSGAEA